MKFLVTGGCGFIGSHLVEKLIEEGNYVEVIDDLSTGSLDNVSSFLNNSNFSLVIDTILNYPILEELVKKADFVFHLAAVVGVKRVLENPIDSIVINVEGTHNILKACAKFNKRVLLTSTSEIYGKNKNVPFSEDADIVIGTTTKKRWGYACAKALDEFLALGYFEKKGLPVIIVRLFNTVGPRQSDRYGMVLPRFVKQALTNSPITVFGSGNQTRCFVHVKDVVDALIKLIKKEEAYGEVLNLGSDKEITIRELAEMVKKISGSNSQIIYVNPKDLYNEGFEDMERRAPDISKVKKLIGFTPKYTLEDIIREVMEYYRNRL
ncbi:MAG: nucleoside-diphosphate sugar epimerase [Candidatus Omnitrophota bacterium]|nr:MAG: nucleoside-diphosphate sugar epimerase [Candidatus Omnitrophota bacterium]HDN97616.1 NAD-dependent epimerase/dehydratase family protein [bacterium]